MGLAKNVVWGNLRKDPYAVIKEKSLLERRTDWQEKTVLEAMGTPITVWKWNNSGIECWCNKDGIPDSRHKLCYGTGYLDGYQKYGYITKTFSTTSPNLILSNIRVSGNFGESFILKQGTEGYVETDWIELTNNKEYKYFKIFEKIEDIGNFWIETFYSLDGINWISFTDVSTIPLSEEKIKFRIYLKRASIQMRMPSFQYFRFRFRTSPTLRELNPRFEIDEPAILTVKSATERVLQQTEHGLVQTFPIRFQISPEFRIESRDIAMFLMGTYKDLRFQSENSKEATVGKDQKILNIIFDTRFIYKEQDVTGIVYTLD